MANKALKLTKKELDNLYLETLAGLTKLHVRSEATGDRTRARALFVSMAAYLDHEGVLASLNAHAKSLRENGLTFQDMLRNDPISINGG